MNIDYKSLAWGAALAGAETFYRFFSEPSFDFGDAKGWGKAVALTVIGYILARLKPEKP